MEKKSLYSIDVYYRHLHLPSDEELKNLKLDKSDGEFVFLRSYDNTVAYVTKSAHSDNYFLNMASPEMKEKTLKARAYKVKDKWEIHYFPPPSYTDKIAVGEDLEFFTTLLNEVDAKLKSKKPKTLAKKLLLILAIFLMLLGFMLQSTNTTIDGREIGFPVQFIATIALIISICMSPKKKHT